MIIIIFNAMLIVMYKGIIEFEVRELDIFTGCLDDSNSQMLSV